MEPKEIVPAEFYKGNLEKPYAETVGELIEQLRRLPEDMMIQHGFDHGCRLVVYNIKDDPFLEICDSDD